MSTQEEAGALLLHYTINGTIYNIQVKALRYFDWNTIFKYKNIQKYSHCMSTPEEDRCTALLLHCTEKFERTQYEMHCATLI